jgi:hypothetical protein
VLGRLRYQYCEFEASQGKIIRPCLKKEEEKKKNQTFFVFGLCVLFFALAV